MRSIARHADYLISLKGNQETVHEEVKELFETTFKDREKAFRSHTETDKGHGRLVTRKCTQTGWVDWFEDLDKWAGLRSFCMIETETLRASRFVIECSASSGQQPVSCASTLAAEYRPLNTVHCDAKHRPRSSTRIIRASGQDMQRRTSPSCGISHLIC